MSVFELLTSYLGNGGFWRLLQQEGFDQFDRLLEL